MWVDIGYLYMLVMCLPMCCVSELIFWCTTCISGGWVVLYFYKRKSCLLFILFSLLCLVKLRNYSKSLWTFYYLICNTIFMRKVNGYSNNTDLQNTFRNFLDRNIKNYNNKKVTFLLLCLFITNSLMSVLKLFINKWDLKV